jgi:hypothetical protein
MPLRCMPNELAPRLAIRGFIDHSKPEADPDFVRTVIEEVAPDVRERVTAAGAQGEPVAATTPAEPSQ